MLSRGSETKESWTTLRRCSRLFLCRIIEQEPGSETMDVGKTYHTSRKRKVSFNSAVIPIVKRLLLYIWRLSRLRPALCCDDLFLSKMSNQQLNPLTLVWITDNRWWISLHMNTLLIINFLSSILQKFPTALYQSLMGNKKSGRANKSTGPGFEFSIAYPLVRYSHQCYAANIHKKFSPFLSALSQRVANIHCSHWQLRVLYVEHVVPMHEPS